MIYEASKVAADGLAGADIKLVDPMSGEALGLVRYADTETGLLKGFVVDEELTAKLGCTHLKMTPFVRDEPTAEKPVGTLRREFVLEEVQGTKAFDVIDRNTGDVIHSFRP